MVIKASSLFPLYFDVDVLIESIDVSSFGGNEEGLVSIVATGGTTPLPSITSTGQTSFSPAGLIEVGDALLVAFSPADGGTGFSFDAFSVAAAPDPPTGGVIPEPMSMLVWAGLASIFGMQTRRRRVA